MRSLTVKNELVELEKVRKFLRENLKGLSVSEEDYFKIELSLIEMCTNIIRYAYPREGDGEIFLKTWLREGKIYLEIRDNGIPFDPSKAEKPDIGRIITSEKKGGLGIFLSRRLMDGFSYRREDTQNVLLMFKKAKKAVPSVQ